MWDMLENYKEVVDALEATNESVISHSVNDVLRVLTVFSVFFLPLTLIASVFGMNNRIPGQGSVEGFWLVVGVMVLTLGGMLAYFRRRGWL
jgi:magnesium transporter